jgi:hypothetical protein
MEGNMPGKSRVRSVLVYLGLAFFALGFAVTARAAKKSSPPSIDGTYRFVYRELPDGTKQMPPDVVGVNSFSHGVRNFNIYWHDTQGKRFSISYIANYKFDGKEYSEKSLYMMSDDEIGGKGISYDLTGPSGMSKVTVKGARISFQLPNYGEPAVVFDGNTFTASRPGAFVDHWEKVK